MILFTNAEGIVFRAVENPASTVESISVWWTAVAAALAGGGVVKWRALLDLVARAAGYRSSVESDKRFEELENRVKKLEEAKS